MEVSENLRKGKSDMKQIKRIDIHCHVTAFPELVPKYKNGSRLLDGNEMIELYEKINVEKGIILPTVAAEGDWVPGNNENAILVARQFPEHFYWFCNVDPRAGANSEKEDLSLLLEHYKSMGAKGVGEITANIYADDPRMDNLFAHCAATDMPALIHISPKLDYSYGIVDDRGLPRIEKMLKKHPDLKLIGHSQGFWTEISDDIAPDDWKSRVTHPKTKVKEGTLARLMREYGNLYCDLSATSGSNAMMRDPEYAAKFIEEFSDRIMYGTDVCGAHQTFHMKFDEWLLEMVENGMISEANYRKIVRENAIRILKLEQ